MNQLFNIFRVDEEEAVRIASAPNEPHDHDFEELLVGIEGELEHFIDFKSTRFSAPYISFVTKGKLHRVRPLPRDGKLSIWGIRFKSEFIPETTFQLYSYYHDYANIVIHNEHAIQRMETLCRMMFDLVKQDNPDYAVARQLLIALFTMIESERKAVGQDENSQQTTQNITFKNFLKIVEENFRRPEGVEFYANKLFMSVRNLNLICQQILQQSVSEIIETRKLIEAKNLLVNSDKTIAEIGFELGYQEKSYFTNVFKKKSGQTPSEFRAEMKKLIS